MRKIGIRQFQQNFHKELKDLPFIVTKDGKEYCEVNVSQTDVTTTAVNAFQNYPLVRTSGGKLVNIGIDLAGEDSKDISVINVDLDKINFPDASQLQDPKFGLVKACPAGRCEAPNTNCKGVGKGYCVTFMTDEGEKKKEIFLCDAHVKKAKSSGTEVQEINL